MGLHTMTVYKALKDGVSPVQNTPWPLPDGDKPGDWLAASGKPELCKMGVHGWLTETLAKAQGNQVFEMEIEGDIVKDHEKAAGRRGRLIRQVSGSRTVTLGEVVVAARDEARAMARRTGGSFPEPSLLAAASTRLGMTVESLRKALAGTDVHVYSHGQFVPLGDYVINATPGRVERRVKRLARMSLTIQIGA